MRKNRFAKTRRPAEIACFGRFVVKFKLKMSGSVIIELIEF